MRIRQVLFAAGLVLVACASTVRAGEIARWVDDEGVTHFGNPQFAPGDPDEVTLVKVAPANGMAVPPTTEKRPSQGRTRFVRVDKKPKSNPRGWQGHQSTVNRNRNSRRRR